MTCLERQLSEIAGGPETDNYDNANAVVAPALDSNDDGALSADEQCKDMIAAHAGLGITDEQFEALDLHAATALTLALGSPAAESRAGAIVNAVVAALTSEGICAAIVEAADEATACEQFDPANDPDDVDAP